MGTWAIAGRGLDIDYMYVNKSIRFIFSLNNDYNLYKEVILSIIRIGS